MYPSVLCVCLCCVRTVSSPSTTAATAPLLQLGYASALDGVQSSQLSTGIKKISNLSQAHPALLL